MQFWVDSFDIQSIHNTAQMIPLTGVTTNPSIVQQSGQGQRALIAQLLDEQLGFVAVQVKADSVESICTQARELSAISDRIFVKIPATQAGIRAMQICAAENIPIMATAVYLPQQFMQIAPLNLSYIAVYLQRGLVQQLPMMCYLEEMIRFKETHGFTTKCLIAGCPLEDIKSMLLKPIDAITLKPAMVQQFFAPCEWTEADTQKFNEDFAT